MSFSFCPPGTILQFLDFVLVDLNRRQRQIPAPAFSGTMGRRNRKERFISPGGMRLPPATAMTSRKLRRHLPSGQRRLAAGLHPRRPQPIVAALIPSCLFVATRFHLVSLWRRDFILSDSASWKLAATRIGSLNRPQATRRRLSQKHKKRNTFSGHVANGDVSSKHVAETHF